MLLIEVNRLPTIECNNRCNILCMTFVNFIETELEKRNWNREELARRAGITSSAISLVYSGKRNPGTEMCRGIARAFKMPETIVFQAAGIMEPIEENPPNFDELKYWFTQMSDDEQEAFLAQGRITIEIRERRKQKEKRQQPNSEIS